MSFGIARSTSCIKMIYARVLYTHRIGMHPNDVACSEPAFLCDFETMIISPPIFSTGNRFSLADIDMQTLVLYIYNIKNFVLICNINN